LSDLGIPLISWSIYDNEEIPNEASSIFIPGGSLKNMLII